MIMGDASTLNDKYIGMIGKVIGASDEKHEDMGFISKDLYCFLRSCLIKSKRRRKTSEQLLRHRIFEHIDISGFKEVVRKDEGLRRVRDRMRKIPYSTVMINLNGEEVEEYKKIRGRTIRGRFILEDLDRVRSEERLRKKNAEKKSEGGKGSEELENTEKNSLELNGAKGEYLESQVISSRSSSSEYKRGRFLVKESLIMKKRRRKETF
jgi:serine/threonine protein kinase